MSPLWLWNMDPACWLWVRSPDFETKCLRELLRNSYLEHKTNDWVRSKINFLVGPQEPSLTTVKRRKLAWLRHVRRHDSLSKTILQGTLEDGRRCGRQKKCWVDSIKEWTSLPMPDLLRRASVETLEEGLCWLVPHVPLTTQLAKGLNWTNIWWCDWYLWLWGR